MANNQKVIILTVIVSAILFFAGGLLGILYQKGRSGTDLQIKKAQEVISTVDTLSSKVIQSIVLFGQVKNISGNNITLSSAGDETQISILPLTKVFSIVNASNDVPKQADVSSIKTGDMVSATLKLSDGKLKCDSLYIIVSQKK